MQGSDDLLSLSQAAKHAPGRPSSNALWRWCRRGVLSRTGERVYLRHQRVGGKMFTTKQWLDDFGSTLADADTAYFRPQDEDVSSPSPSGPKRRRHRFEQHRRQSMEQASQELREAGL